MLKGYLALDIETTGVDIARSQVLQVAAIWDDGGDISKLRTFDVLVDNFRITYGEPFALQLNSWIFAAIVSKDSRVKHRWDARDAFSQFIDGINGGERVAVAGKNAAGFDIPILRNQGFDASAFAHRVIDVGSLYLPDFGYVPNMTEINTKLGRKPVSHNALSDCYDVVHAIRAKFGK